MPAKFLIPVHTHYAQNYTGIQRNLSLIRDQRTKKQGNKGTAKSCKIREVLYTLVDINP